MNTGNLTSFLLTKELQRSTFNVNFNVNFNISVEYLIVHPLDKIKKIDIIKMHGTTIKK